LHDKTWIINNKGSTLQQAFITRTYLWLRKSLCDSSKPLFSNKFIPSLAKPWYSQNPADDLASLRSLHSFLFGFIGTPQPQPISMNAYGLAKNMLKYRKKIAPCFDTANFAMREAEKCKAFYDWSADSLECFRRFPSSFRIHTKITRKCELLWDSHITAIQYGVRRFESSKAVILRAEG